MNMNETQELTPLNLSEEDSQTPYPSSCLLQHAIENKHLVSKRLLGLKLLKTASEC